MVNGFQIVTNREKKPVAPRAWVLVAAIALAFAGLAGSLYSLQIQQGDRYHQLAEGNRVRRLVVPAPRGVIYDRHGQQLVENVGSYSLAVVPADLPRNKAEREKVLARLQRDVGIPLPELTQQIEDARKAQPFQPKELLKRLTPEQAMVLREESTRLPGVQVVVVPERHYLESMLVSHLIGYIGKLSPEEYARLKDEGYLLDDQIGKAGLEVSQEDFLRGRPGVMVQETDVNGVGIRNLSESPSVPGNNVYLTIDSGLQRYAGQVLEAGMKAAREGKAVGADGLVEPLREAVGPNHALTGAAVVMNPLTGEVLAMFSSPSYDINLFAKGVSSRDYDALAEDIRLPLVNRAINAEYPPGSTFKMVTAAAALQEGKIDRGSTVFCPGALNYGGQIFRCWLGSGHGSQSVVGALARSCDVFFYTMGDRVGDVALARYMKDFGLGAKTGIELGPESLGAAPDHVNNPKFEWFPGTKVQMGIGQGPILVTPLQILNMVNTIWNGGSVLRPTLIEQVVDAGGWQTRALKPEVTHKVKVAPQHLATLRDGMRAGVTESGGTSNQFQKFVVNGRPISVAGKTGTAQYGSRGELTHAWYVAAAPTEAPEVSVMVFVSNAGEGFWHAEPIAKQILTYYFQHRDEIVSHASAPLPAPNSR
jgi:penicillin-binding protein 2